VKNTPKKIHSSNSLLFSEEAQFSQIPTLAVKVWFMKLRT